MKSLKQAIADNRARHPREWLYERCPENHVQFVHSEALGTGCLVCQTIALADVINAKILAESAGSP